ncbi:MAG: hypothetical protein ACLSXC_05110 [Beduini sp.]
MKQLNEKELHATEGGLFEVFIIIGITYGMYLQLKNKSLRSKDFGKWG